MNENKIRVLTFVDYYLPGYKGGGPIVSVSRLVRALKDSVEFCIFTRDRDLGDSEPYAGLTVDLWTSLGDCTVYYASPRGLGTRTVLTAIRSCGPEAIYLNSFFSRMTLTVLALRLFGRLPSVRIVIAPRGEFSPGALAIKAKKKNAFIGIAKLIGLYKGVVWKPSTPQERADVKSVFHDACCVVLPEIPAQPTLLDRPVKTPGECRFVFLSRVSPKKNLEFALDVLSGMDGEIVLDVHGPMESDAYESKLLAKCKALPTNVVVRFHGSLIPREVPGVLRRAHFFLFPTRGENFGHVIAESLAVGLPCVLSDTTPWSDIESAGAGCVVSLSDPERWLERLRECVGMDDERYGEMSICAIRYYSDWLGRNDVNGADAIFMDVTRETA